MEIGSSRSSADEKSILLGYDARLHWYVLSTFPTTGVDLGCSKDGGSKLLRYFVTYIPI
jgi:hypothetical protein